MISKKEEAKEAKQISYKKYTVDFNSPVDNKLLTLEAALKYLQSNMKINGLKGKLVTQYILPVGKKDANECTEEELLNMEETF